MRETYALTTIIIVIRLRSKRTKKIPTQCQSERARTMILPYLGVKFLLCSVVLFHLPFNMFLAVCAKEIR